MVESLLERSARVPHGEGDQLHPSPLFLEGRDERKGRGVFFCLFSFLNRGCGFFFNGTGRRIVVFSK